MEQPDTFPDDDGVKHGAVRVNGVATWRVPHAQVVAEPLAHCGKCRAAGRKESGEPHCHECMLACPLRTGPCSLTVRCELHNCVVDTARAAFTLKVQGCKQEASIKENFSDNIREEHLRCLVMREKPTLLGRGQNTAPTGQSVTPDRRAICMFSSRSHCNPITFATLVGRLKLGSRDCPSPNDKTRTNQRETAVADTFLPPLIKHRYSCVKRQ